MALSVFSNENLFIGIWSAAYFIFSVENLLCYIVSRFFIFGVYPYSCFQQSETCNKKDLLHGPAKVGLTSSFCVYYQLLSYDVHNVCNDFLS